MPFLIQDESKSWPSLNFLDVMSFRRTTTRNYIRFWTSRLKNKHFRNFKIVIFTIPNMEILCIRSRTTSQDGQAWIFIKWITIRNFKTSCFKNKDFSTPACSRGLPASSFVVRLQRTPTFSRLWVPLLFILFFEQSNSQNPLPRMDPLSVLHFQTSAKAKVSGLL